MPRYGGDYGRGGGSGRDYDRAYRGYDQGYRRPWTGGYPPDYPGGSYGIPARAGTPRHQGDLWWLGEREIIRNGPPPRYDEAYRRFNAESHPRYSPVGGTYAAMGGRYMYGRPPRPLREDTWFSDWTRWF